MKRCVLTVLFTMLWIALYFVGTFAQTNADVYRQIGSLSSTSTTLISSAQTWATDPVVDSAVFCNTGPQAIHYEIDGGDPIAGSGGRGHVLRPTQCAWIYGLTNLKQLRAIAELNGNGGLPTTFFLTAFRAGGTAPRLWDFPRASPTTWFINTGDAGSLTVTGNGVVNGNPEWSAAMITLTCTSVLGTSPTLAAQLQWSPDEGATFLAFGPASGTITTGGQTIVIVVGPTNWSQTAGAAPANLAIGATQTVAINAFMPHLWRLTFTLGGTSPNFTVTSTVNYHR